jgi:hypothetical protein
MDVAKPQRRALGRRSGRLAPAGALGGSLRATPLARVQAVGWRIGGVGVAHATGKCAIVLKIGFRPPWTPADEAPARCRAEPDRKGRVGVAHATRKCAIVHNISQAWGSNPPA